MIVTGAFYNERWLASEVDSEAGAGLSALLTGVWLFIGVVTLLNEPEPVTWESWFMGGAIVTAVLLTAVAWWNDRMVGKIILNWRAI